jgi:IS5 family transposase
MHSSKKGNQWHFGAKLHVGVDAETGLMHTVKLNRPGIRGGHLV